MRATDGGKSPGPQQQNRKLWDRLISTVVAENTQPAPSQDAARKLIKYLSNPQTVDIVYEKLIERVNASKTQSQQVVPLTVKLLKTNLTQHVPSKETLHKLDMFCIALKSDSPIVSKSIQFVRNLIKKELSPLSKLGGSGGSESKPLAVVSGSSGKLEVLNYPKSPVVEKHALHGHGHSHPTPVKSRNNGTPASREGDVDTIKGTGADGNKHLTGSSSPDHHSIKGIGGDRDRARDNSQELIADFLALNASQCDATLPIEDVSLATTSVFGSQLRRLSTSAGVKGSDVSDDLRIHDSETVRNHIKIVSMAKKQEEEQLYKQAGLVTLRRKGVQLFQYIYYKDQLPLSLPPEEMEQVVNSVVSSPQEDHESCLIASKILIKLLVDMYCSDGDAASRLLLSLLFEMLESSQTHTKVHAFNLLWNLSIHMNLLEEIATLPEEGGEGGGRETDAYKRIQAIQEDLFAVVKEMLLFLFHKGEKDEKVWSAALNCALFFITNQGRLDKAKLGSLDPRILPTIITSIETLSDEMYRQLMRCFVNMLYTDKQELNVKLLLRACPGGISWIIRHYVRCRSDVVRGNLFTVIFHYILYKIKRTKKQKAAMILQLLASVHAPLYFTQLFRSPPPNFVKDFMTFMHDQLQIAPSFAPPANAPSHASPVSSASSAASSASSSAANSTTTTPPNTPHQSAQHTPPPSPSTSFSSSYTPLLASTPVSASSSLSTSAAGGSAGSASGVSSLSSSSNSASAASASSSGSLGGSSASNASASLSASAAAAASATAGSASTGGSLGSSSGGMAPLNTLSAAATSKLVETKLLEMVLVGFHKLATDHLKLEPEYAGKLLEITKLDSPRSVLSHIRGLSELLHSPSAAESWQGELWLFELLQLSMDTRKGAMPEQQQAPVRDLFHGLLASDNPRVRRIYSSVTERLLLSLKAQLREPMKETGLTEVFKLLNDNFGRVVASGEKDVTNLLFVLDVLFNVITYRTDVGTSSSSSSEEMYRDKGGDQYDEFLCGRISIAHQLLKRVDINILVYLSVHLPKSNLINSINDAKVTTLVMIIHKCTKENEALEAIGGVSFFKKLLVETNPQIAYHASRFIIEQLRRERPEQYQAIFKQLLQRAQVTKDDKLLSNYYLQVISIIEMNTVHNKALGTARRTARAPPAAALGTARGTPSSASAPGTPTRKG